MTIKRRDFLKKAGAGAGAVALGACGPGETAAVTGGAAVSGPRVEWRLSSSYPPSTDILYWVAERIAERVSTMTGGNFTIRVYAPGEIVPGGQVMDAVMQGTTQCGLSPGYYYMGKNPALAFDTCVPFGLDSRGQIAWLHHGGGPDLINSGYADFGVMGLPAACTGTQMGGWFREEIGGLSDLTGLRMRIPGVGGEIMVRLGVTVQALQAAEIYPALERGAIDATEWVGPHDDEKLGFYQVAKHYYYPGWWEPGSTSTFMMNLAAYEDLPSTYRELLHTVCNETMVQSMARYDAMNPPALQRLLGEGGVTLHEFPTDIMEAAWDHSAAYLEEQAADDAQFREVYESWKAFRATSFSWFNSNESSYARFAFPRV